METVPRAVLEAQGSLFTSSQELSAVRQDGKHGRALIGGVGELDGMTANPAEVARSLRAVLAAVESGALDADDVQRAYLTGAAESLEGIATPD
ncbi:hypothetical protein [Pseudonocardia endophytica]|uniref:hypothetical protein n=1 Tax=Pseudonocardia endophytica TaxID=401976 RepID=UPI00104418B4|nr:hypothetical protein [Pseudonocardia endophytica]